MPSVARVVVLKDPLDCVLTYIALSTVYVVSGVLNNVIINMNSVLSHPTCNYLGNGAQGPQPVYNCRDTWAEVQSRGDVWEIPPGSDLSLEDGSLMGVVAEEAAE